MSILFSFRARFRWGYYLLFMRWKRISWPLGKYGRSSLSKKIPSKLVNKEMMERLQSLNNINAADSISCRMFFKETGCIISRSQGHFLTRYQQEHGNVSVDGSSHDPKSLIAYFRSKKFHTSPCYMGR